MKPFLLFIIIIMGCSKADIKPSDALTGHWSFQSSTVSGDFTILNTSNGYSLQAGGIFTIDGISYACDQFWIPRRSFGHTIDIYLGSPIANDSREAMLIFSINLSELPYTAQPTNVFYELKKGKGLVHVKEAFVLQKK